MAYIDIYNAANDADFQGRCLVATWRAAQDIVMEAPDIPNHPDRVDWARRVLQDRPNLTPRQLAMQVLRNPVIADAPAVADDGAIQYQVNTILESLIAVG